MKDKNGRTIKKAKVVAWTDERVIECAGLDFSARAGRKEVEPSDLEAIAKALRGAKDEDSMFFAACDAARELGAAVNGWKPKTAEFAVSAATKRGRALNRLGFVDLTDERERPFRTDGAVAFANAMTKRAAILTENEDGTFDGHVLEPGETCAIVDGRVIGREPLVKGRKEGDGVVLPLPYTYQFDWQDPKDGRFKSATETSFAETKARFPDEAEFPLAFFSTDSKNDRTSVRAFEGGFYKKGTATFEETWRGRIASAKRGYVYAELSRVEAAKEAAAAGGGLVVRADEEAKAQNAAAAKAEIDALVFRDGVAWARVDEPRYVVAARMFDCVARLTFCSDEEIEKRYEHASLAYKTYSVADYDEAMAKYAEWKKMYRQTGRSVDPVRLEIADPAFVTRPRRARTESAADALKRLGVDELDARAATEIAEWAKAREGSRFEAYGSLSELETEWIANGGTESGLLEALASGDAKMVPEAGKTFAAFDD